MESCSTQHWVVQEDDGVTPPDEFAARPVKNSETLCNVDT